jgi:DNA-directed RNA polymerase subunit RPC12/RpoP
MGCNMFKYTIVEEENRYRPHGFTIIDWRCKRCKCVMSLPQQQLFDYCFHCGGKVIYKKGGDTDA